MTLYLTNSEEEEEDHDVCNYDDDDFLFFNILVKLVYQYNKLLSKFY